MATTKVCPWQSRGGGWEIYRLLLSRQDCLVWQGSRIGYNVDSVGTVRVFGARSCIRLAAMDTAQGNAPFCGRLRRDDDLCGLHCSNHLAVDGHHGQRVRIGGLEIAKLLAFLIDGAAGPDVDEAGNEDHDPGFGLVSKVVHMGHWHPRRALSHQTGP